MSSAGQPLFIYFAAKELTTMYYPPMNFLDLERFSTNEADYADQRNPAFLVDIARRLNEQADRLEFLFMDIVTNPNHQSIEYKDILPWRQRIDYLRNVGQAKAARELEKREALKEAKAKDDDEEFMEGYKTFLAEEFDLS